MARTYWIDAGVLIQAERGPYPQKRVPQFWKFIHESSVAGHIRMPRRAWREVVEGGYTDELALWCKNRKDLGLCIHEGPDVQDRYRVVATNVASTPKYKAHQIHEFLRGGDGWLIAHAMANADGVVVTQELKPMKGKIKIPTVCSAVDVRCWNTRQMLDALEADFSGGMK